LEIKMLYSVKEVRVTTFNKKKYISNIPFWNKKYSSMVCPYSPSPALI
jgi:hypothetical protein